MPSHLGPYRIREPLAEGTFTSLSRAQHERLGRVVLLKTIKKNLAEGSPFAVALDREAKILSRLAHPSLPRLLEVSLDTPPSWLTLENVEGSTLAAVMQKTPRFEMASAVAIAVELAYGLGHAHMHHIVHRNVEPHGIVVSKDGRAVLLDFGLADDTNTTSTFQYDSGDGLFGHRYTAPEQIMGESATPQSDVFSLGVVLYEMLCGKGPWDEGKPSPTELSRRIRSADPALPSAHGLRLPSELLHIVMRCLSKRPEERFENGTELAKSLETVLDTLSSSPSPMLVMQALAIAGLGELPVEEKLRRKRKRVLGEQPLRQLAFQLGMLSALILTGTVVFEVLLRDTKIASVSEERLGGAERGYIRVVAHPWADVSVDGRFIDSTPMAKPIIVSAGRHYVTFKHPNAPDEQREMNVASGQTVFVDVTMRIDRRTVDAGVDAASDAAISP